MDEGFVRVRGMRTTGGIEPSGSAIPPNHSPVLKRYPVGQG